MRAVRVPGPRTSWRRLLREMESAGVCVLYASVGDWAAYASGSGEQAGAYPLLTEAAERRRLERLTRPLLRARFTASRALLKSAAGAVLGARPGELELAYEPGGRPRLRGIGQLEISLSHTGDLITAGLSWTGRIGVDVEAADRRMLALGTEQRMCLPAELRRLRRLPEAERNRELVRLWTLKEAYSKAIGQGLRFGFTEFGFDFPGGPPGPRLLRGDGTPAPAAEWTFGSRLVGGTHWVSGAFHDPGFGTGRGTGTRHGPASGAPAADAPTPGRTPVHPGSSPR